MYNFKGFMSYGNLHDNTVGVIAPIGELSTNALTYAKEKGYYNIPEAPNAGLISFYSKDSTQKQLIKVPVQYSNVMLEIGQWLYNQTITGTIQNNSNALTISLNQVFSDKINNLIVGPMKTDGDVWLPEWIQFNLTVEGPFDESQAKIWFSNDAFEQQYDEYEIEFIAPIERLDDFFKNALQVKALVDAVSLTQLMLKVETVKEKNPYTFLRSNRYNYHDFLNKDWTHPTNWTIILYGISGNNIDVIKRELQEWILERSNHTVEDWKKIFPDIFTNTEFIITPLWDQYSVPNRTIQAGMYSPTTEFFRIAKVAKRTCKGDGYTTDHILNNTSISSSMYKSIQFLACGGPENRNGVIKFYDQFTDYMAVSSTGGDFNRMSLKTQEWVMFITELFIVAENMTVHSPMPVGVSRLFREDVLYAVGTFDDIQYLVVSRRSMEELGGFVLPDFNLPEDDDPVAIIPPTMLA